MPNQLQIGDKIRCTALVEFRYNDNNKKLPELLPIPNGIEAIYIGNQIRYSGEYNKGGSYFSLDGEDYKPSSFTNKKRYTVYQIRTDPNSKIMEALPDHVFKT